MSTVDVSTLIPQIEFWTYYGQNHYDLERQLKDLVDRGGKVLSFSIGYGPTPAKAASKPWGENAWHVLDMVDTTEIRDSAPKRETNS